MSELIAAFAAGNLAILSNVCMLPLYPGLIAFMAGTANSARPPRAAGLLGVLVLAGILSTMLVIGFLLYLLQQSLGSLLTILLPLIYGIVVLLGILMITGRNPFARLASARSPMLSNPYLTAYLYGVLFGPMTLPCTGPIILSAFVVGAGSTGALADGIAYFLAFGLGFGWPLVVLPLFALPAQRRFTTWLSHNHLLLNRISGIFLIAVGLFGMITELLPRWLASSQIEINGPFIIVYWLIVLLLGAFTAYRTWTQGQIGRTQQ